VNDIIFVLDVFLGFVTAYYLDHGELVIEAAKISKQYLGSQAFFLDVIAASPILFDCIPQSSEGSFDVTMLLVILKLPRYNKVRQLFKVRAASHVNFKIIGVIFQPFAFFLITTHYMTCIFRNITIRRTGVECEPTLIPWCMSRVHEANTNSMVHELNPNVCCDPEESYLLYMYALFFCMMFGSDINPHTSAERGVLMVIGFIGVLYCAVFSSAIITAMTYSMQKSVKWSNLLDQVTGSQDFLHLPNHAQDRVINYLQVQGPALSIFFSH
jgi:hypothetical protein